MTNYKMTQYTKFTPRFKSFKFNTILMAIIMNILAISAELIIQYFHINYNQNVFLIAIGMAISWVSLAICFKEKNYQNDLDILTEFEIGSK